MELKPEVTCPYCLAQGLIAKAERDRKFKPLVPETMRFGCPNGHFFAIPAKDVKYV